MDRSDRLIVALDVENYAAAAAMVDKLAEDLTWYKIGAKLFTREGPRVCKLIKDTGGKLFLDLKYHDIPNTVHDAVLSALATGADMMTLHASGGPEMLSAARKARDGAGAHEVILVAVTVLTHHHVDDFANLFGSNRKPDEMVVSLARTAKDAGMTGVVASARELRLIKENLGGDFVVVTPGIRLPDAGKDDQTRVVTPEAAIKDGADYIVVGRPIIAAPDPAAACRHIIDRMNGA